ncbi:MAG: CpsD/CapB family tyrosine-protein kinase [Candidatus Eisenbacteria bacterium]|nr:CpsD/CapB family tyrosine-protein kinase [Candidatus Eisenbacteria bacterium]
MSRIFDALRKAEAGRSAPPPALAAPAMTPPPASVTPIPSSSAHSAARALGSAAQATVLHATVLAGLPDQVMREMTTLRVSLESSIVDREPRTVVFMSAQGGEGTSTVAAQFVIALASDPRSRVLFVDANAQRPALRPGEPGSLAGLFGVGSDAQGAPVVDLLPVPEAIRGTEIYSPADLEARLDALGSRYDWIVLDGPPVLYAAEASSLAAVAECVVMVVEAGRTKKPVLSRSVDLLRKAGARVLGSVLNRRLLEIPEFIYRRI